MRTQTNTFGRINDGLSTKFNASDVKFKKTFISAKKLGIDLNATNVFIKKEGWIYLVSVTSFIFRGKHHESFNLLPYLNISK